MFDNDPCFIYGQPLVFVSDNMYQYDLFCKGWWIRLGLRDIIALLTKWLHGNVSVYNTCTMKLQNILTHAFCLPCDWSLF